jgi:peptide methionine sulfoxide reductase MsrA
MKSSPRAISATRADSGSARSIIRQLDASGTFAAPIVTEITPFKSFYPAEKYHQDYYEQNPGERYCQYVIRPKVEKFRKEFADLLDDAPQTTAAQR